MIALLLFVIVGIAMAFFATQNVIPVSITLANNTLHDIPLYVIVLGSILLGVFISSLISFINMFSTTFTLHGKDTALHNANKKIQVLEKQNQQLERDVARLTTERRNITQNHPSLFPHFHPPLSRA